MLGYIRRHRLLSLRVMTFNIHGGLGPAREGAWEDFYKGNLHLEPVIECIRDARPDLVALQEVAVLSLNGRTLDQPRVIAEALGMDYRYGPANSVRLPDRDGIYGMYLFGNMVLSRLPIVHSRFHGLSSPGDTDLVDPPGSRSPGAGLTYGQGAPGWREPRGLLQADVDTPEGRLLFASTHMSWIGQEQITHQARDAAQEICRQHGPVVLGGDFNVPLSSPALQPLHAVLKPAFEASGEAGEEDVPLQERLSFPTGKRPLLDIDHLFVSEDVRVGRAYVYREHPEASDHYPVIAEICLSDPKTGEGR